MILIVTEPFDPHVDHVVPELERRDIPYQRIHLSDFPSNGTVTIIFGGSLDRGLLVARDQTIELNQLTSVWLRRRPRFGMPDSMGHEERLVAEEECRSLLRGLWRSLPHVVWVSHPDAIAAADAKPEQLRRARDLGFSVPRTCFSNDPEQIRTFCSTLGGPDAVVYKPFNPMMFRMPGDKYTGVVYATRLSERDLDRLDEVRLCPGIFQERVPKRRDIRVTVFGDRVFAVGIESQNRGATAEDWRAYPWSDPSQFPEHLALEIDSSLADRCVELVQSYGLSFGAIDLVESSQGEFIFLEINPNGQWAWIEERTGLPMRNALVDLLARSHSPS